MKLNHDQSGLLLGCYSVALTLAFGALSPTEAQAAKKKKLVDYSCSSSVLSSCNGIPVGSARVIQGNSARVDVTSAELQAAAGESVLQPKIVSGKIVVQGSASASAGIRSISAVLIRGSRVIHLLQQDLADRPLNQDFSFELNAKALGSGPAELVIGLYDGSELCFDRKNKNVSCSSSKVSYRYYGSASLRRKIHIENLLEGCVSGTSNDDGTHGICITSPQLYSSHSGSHLRVQIKAAAPSGLYRVYVRLMNRADLRDLIEGRRVGLPREGAADVMFTAGETQASLDLDIELKDRFTQEPLPAGTYALAGYVEDVLFHNNQKTTFYGAGLDVSLTGQ